MQPNLLEAARGDDDNVAELLRGLAWGVFEFRSHFAIHKRWSQTWRWQLGAQRTAHTRLGYNREPAPTKFAARFGLVLALIKEWIEKMNWINSTLWHARSRRCRSRFCMQILVWKLLTWSTRRIYFCTAQTSKFQQTYVHLLCYFKDFQTTSFLKTYFQLWCAMLMKCSLEFRECF